MSFYFAKKSADGVEKAQLFSEIVQQNPDSLTPSSTQEEVLALGYVTVLQPMYPHTGKDYKPGIPVFKDDKYEGTWVEQETPTYEIRKAIRARSERRNRDQRIQDVSWRYERFQRHARLGLPQVDTIEALDAYIQALADVPNQDGFPFQIDWPTLNS